MSIDNPLEVENEADIRWAFENLLGPSHRLTLTCGYCGETKPQLWSAKTATKWFHHHDCATTFSQYDV